MSPERASGWYIGREQLSVIQTSSLGSITSECYARDPSGNVTSQTVNGTTTSYSYDRGLLETATTGGSANYYNYDPLGRLDTCSRHHNQRPTPTAPGLLLPGTKLLFWPAQHPGFPGD